MSVHSRWMIVAIGALMMSGRRLTAVAAIGCLLSLPGCGGVSGTSGDEGTVDLVKSQEAAAKNPAIAKKAARLGGGTGTPGGKAQ